MCFYTKAVHIELVSDLTSEAFLAALKRFISRRGCPSDLHSDNGTNFVGANNILKEMYSFLALLTTQTTITSYLSTQKINWHFSPERAPHFGGLWKAAVKSTKFHLSWEIGDQKLTFEELSTVLCKVECCLNSRPLVPPSFSCRRWYRYFDSRSFSSLDVTCKPCQNLISHSKNYFCCVAGLFARP